ncbi:Uncharacterised protein [Bordetella pertussis]|nr:Uncharacterised protein [Bordetella pertussis]
MQHAMRGQYRQQGLDQRLRRKAFPPGRKTGIHQGVHDRNNSASPPRCTLPDLPAQPRPAGMKKPTRPSRGLAGHRAPRRRRYQAMILPGLRMLFGSKACLRLRMSASASSPCSSAMNCILCRPTPCSPVQVPSAAIARRTKL